MTDQFDAWRKLEDAAERIEITLDKGTRMIEQINRAFTTILCALALLAALAAGVVLQAELGIVSGTVHTAARAVPNIDDRQHRSMEVLPWPSPSGDPARIPAPLPGIIPPPPE